MAKFTCNFISYTLRRTVDITVVVPSPTIPESIMRPKAQDPCTHTPKDLYPVVYLLHGGGNNHATWTGYTKVEMYAEERNIAIVNISGENKRYIDNGVDDFFTFISQELPDFVTGMFPISKRPEDTYIAGLSMGGYGTLVHVLTHPDDFAAFGAFSASTVARTEDAKIRFEPRKLLEKFADEGKKFPKAYMACGKDDFLYEDNKEFRDLIIGKGADVTWDEIAGYGHEWRFWDIEVERFLDWLPRTDSYAAKGKRKI